MRKTLIGLTTAVLVLAACGEPGLADTLKLNDDPASVLLIVKDEGGFVPIEFIVGQGPRLVLLRDGTLIVSGPQIEIFPQPLLPNYQSIQLGEEDMLFVLEELDALGFAEIESEVNNEAANMVADASTTVTTFYNQDGQHTFSVYALGIGTQVTDGRVPVLANLVEHLSQIGFSQAGTPYEWQGLEVLAGVPQAPGRAGFRQRPTVAPRCWFRRNGRHRVRLAVRPLRGRRSSGTSGVVRRGQPGDHVGRRRHRILDQGATVVPSAGTLHEWSPRPVETHDCRCR